MEDGVGLLGNLSLISVVLNLLWRCLGLLLLCQLPGGNDKRRIVRIMFIIGIGFFLVSSFVALSLEFLFFGGRATTVRADLLVYMSFLFEGSGAAFFCAGVALMLLRNKKVM